MAKLRVNFKLYVCIVQTVYENALLFSVEY